MRGSTDFNDACDRFASADDSVESVRPRRQRIQNLPRSALTWIGLLGVLWIGVGDFITGADIAFTLFYLGPIGFAVWFVGRPTGLLLCILSACTWLLTDVFTRTVSLSVGIHFWNFGAQLGVFMGFAFVLGELKKRLEVERLLARTDDLTNICNRR